MSVFQIIHLSNTITYSTPLESLFIVYWQDLAHSKC